MESTQISLLIFGIIICVAVQNVNGGECYQCNSATKYEGKRCEEPKKNPELLKPCPGNATKYGQLCRQIRQTVDGDFRIVRDCATIVRKDGFKCIQRTGTSKVKVTYCECSGSACNSANSIIIKPIALLFTAISSLIFIMSHL